MNILITRPLIDAEDLMGKLFSLGHKIIHIPTLRILKANIAPIDAKKYGAFDRVLLHARCLSFIHPSNQEKLTFRAELPSDFGTGRRPRTNSLQEQERTLKPD